MGGGKYEEPSSSGIMSDIATQVNAEVTPMRQELGRQMMEALTTGGVGARIPQVQAMTESSGRATSDAMRQISDQLAQSGLSGTPYGQNILAGQQMSGQLQQAQIPNEIVQQLMQAIQPFVLGQGTNVIQGLQGATQGQAAAMQANAGKDAAQLQFLGKFAPTWGFGGSTAPTP